MSFCTGCSRREPVFEDVLAVREDVRGQEDYDAGPVMSEIIREPAEDAPVMVHVCGAVVNPGVYSLKQGCRAVDAVDAAGGFTAEADRDYCNLAAAVYDGQKLQILTVEETAGIKENEGLNPGCGETGETAAGTGININTATFEQLLTLPGIGNVKAQAIIDYRQENGFFKSVEDVMQVEGIKTSVFNKIRGRITV